MTVPKGKGLFINIFSQLHQYDMINLKVQAIETYSQRFLKFQIFCLIG